MSKYIIYIYIYKLLADPVDFDLCLAYFVLHTCRLCLGKLLLSNYFLNKFFTNDAVLIKFAELIWLIKMFVHTKNRHYSTINKL